MRKTIILLLLPVALSACRKDIPETGTASVSPDYRITRSGDAPPAEKTTYTLVSYRDGASTDPDFASNQKPEGSYAYLSDATAGILVPCDVQSEHPYGFVSRNPDKGQRLNAGNFHTAVISPAYPLRTSLTFGSMRVCFQRSDKIYTSEPFAMNLSGYQVFSFPDNLEMKDIRAKISFDIWQGGTTTFTIENPRFRNAGNYGWYHPLLRVTDITNTSESNSAALISSEESCELDSTGNNGTDVRTHSMKDIYVFAADYSSDYTSALVLAFDLKMQGYTFPIAIPIAIKMEQSTRYLFKLTVKSTAVAVSYYILDWEEGYDDGDEYQHLGKPALEIPLGTWSAGEWQEGGGSDGTDDIG